MDDMMDNIIVYEDCKIAKYNSVPNICIKDAYGKDVFEINGMERTITVPDDVDVNHAAETVLEIICKALNFESVMKNGCR